MLLLGRRYSAYSDTHLRLFIPSLYKKLVLAVLSLGVLTAWYYSPYTQMGAGKVVNGRCKMS